jgi:acetyltransferase-like isoleucine patch superfamily enzyme
MGLETILYRISKREGPMYSKIKDILLSILRFNLPAPKLIFRPLYELLIFWRFFSHFIVEKFLYVPTFKSRLDRCGKGLSLANRIPWIEGHLKIMIGDDVILDDNIFTSGHVHEVPLLTIGDRTMLGCKTAINVGHSVQIGKDCMIAAGCLITDNDSHPMDPERRIRKEAVRENEIKPIIIEDNVWIGSRAVILKGVTIGTGSIISANSLVTRSIPPYSIAMGVPAKLVMSGIDKAYQNKSADSVKGAAKE